MKTDFFDASFDVRVFEDANRWGIATVENSVFIIFDAFRNDAVFRFFSERIEKGVFFLFWRKKLRRRDDDKNYFPRRQETSGTFRRRARVGERFDVAGRETRSGPRVLGVWH